jgi:hypothetical protein
MFVVARGGALGLHPPVRINSLLLGHCRRKYLLMWSRNLNSVKGIKASLKFRYFTFALKRFTFPMFRITFVELLNALLLHCK